MSMLFLTRDNVNFFDTLIDQLHPRADELSIDERDKINKIELHVTGVALSWLKMMMLKLIVSLEFLIPALPMLWDMLQRHKSPIVALS